MSLKEPRNPNYAATVVALQNFVDLPNCNNVKGALIFGNHILVGKESKAGDLGLFFPVETQLSAEFLKENNLFRKPDNNADPEKKGYFDDHGRIKAVKFRGHKSEGFFIPLSSLLYIGEVLNSFEEAFGSYDPIGLVPGATFDMIGDHEICKKYVPKFQGGQGMKASRARAPKLEDQIVPSQFRFHFDTENLRRNVTKILPTDFISISDKWHGTSAIISKVLTLRNLRWYERLLRKFGVKIQESEYGFVYSSRRVIKAVNGEEKNSNHYYTQDIWGIVAKEIEDRIPVGFTIYGEIVGFTPDGGAIQKGYHYGCQQGSHKLVVYRVTSTNATGQTIELTWLQMQEFCTKYSFEMVHTLYYGQACNLGSDELKYLAVANVRDWQEDFLAYLQKEVLNEGRCPFNNMEVPAEGIVVRIDRLAECESFKLKSFTFLEWESKLLDKGEVDLETQESEEPAFEEAA